MRPRGERQFARQSRSMTIWSSEVRAIHSSRASLPYDSPTCALRTKPSHVLTVVFSSTLRDFPG